MNSKYPIFRGESAATNSFFNEVYRLKKFDDFFRGVCWKVGRVPFTIKDVQLVFPFPLSGFGTADTLLAVLDDNDKCHVVVVECKMKTYDKSICRKTTSSYFEGKRGKNSYLNNQIALRYRGLSIFAASSTIGEKIEDKLPSHYSSGIARKCVDNDTLKFLREIKPAFIDFYIFIITSDKEAPFSDIEKTVPFYDPVTNEKVIFQNMGFINWDACKNVFKHGESTFPLSLDDYFNGKTSSAAKEGRYIIKHKTTGESLLLYRNKKFSFSARSYKDGRCTIVRNGSKNKSDYDSFIGDYKVIKKAPYEKITKTAFWENELKIA
jgi:hypothetical protein